MRWPAAPAPKVAQAAEEFLAEGSAGVAGVLAALHMFVMVSASGLMATAQIAPIAGDFKVGDQIVFWAATTLTAALIIDNLANGAGAPAVRMDSDTRA